MPLKKIISFITITVFIFFICEFVLRAFYPSLSRVRGNEIILKSNFRKKYIIDDPSGKLNKEIIYSTNSLGFRGPEPPADFKNSLTIITVGSSTTECHLLADDSTWTARLMDKIKSQIPNLWMNNAGINGSSTYGHIILLRDYIVHLKPNYIIFLLGGNEVGKVSFENENGFLINRNESFIRTLFKHSDVLTMISNFIEAHKSIKVDLSKKKNAITNDSETNEINTKQNELRTNYQISISKYLSRINTLDSLCNVNNIKPIFVTHPFYDYGKSDSLNPMSFYNNALVKYCSEKNILFIDLEKKFPKNDPALYYDLVHFNNAGAEKTADILFPELMTIINKRSGR